LLISIGSEGWVGRVLEQRILLTRPERHPKLLPLLVQKFSLKEFVVEEEDTEEEGVNFILQRNRKRERGREEKYKKLK